jgi:hypothetical protein
MGLSFFAKKATYTQLGMLNYHLGESKICKPMNELNEVVGSDGSVRLWLNPNNQKCFNYGWYTYRDYNDWLDGKGAIVKGGTQEEKDKFFEAAVFEANHAYGWAFYYHIKHFDFIDETYKPKIKSGANTLYTATDKPLKITRTNHDEIISKVFGGICRYYSSVYDIENNAMMLKKMGDELQGAKETLWALGVGYSGACNLPEELQNLNFSSDICKYKAIYLNLKNSGVKLPDYDFIINYK